MVLPIHDVNPHRRTPVVTYALIAINIVVFLLQYAVAVVTAMKLQIGIDVAMAGQAVSGACAGYFLGWAVALLRSYRAQTAVAATA